MDKLIFISDFVQKMKEHGATTKKDTPEKESPFAEVLEKVPEKMKPMLLESMLIYLRKTF